MPSRASIIVLNYNGVDLLKKCFRSVAEAANFNGADHEIVLLDNGSSDMSVDYIRRHFPTVKIMASKSNDFMFSYNDAVHHVKSETVILLNNDVIVEKGFVAPLIAPFDDPRVFAVTAKMLTADGQKLLQGRRVGEIKGGFIHPSNPGAENERGFTLFASGGASAFSKAKFIELGGFDALYWPYYHEDLDLSYRAWLRGYTVLYEPKSVVYHFHSASIGKHTDPNSRRLRDKINYLFVWKNVSDPIWLMKSLVWTVLRILKAVMMFDLNLIYGFRDAFLKLPRAVGSRRQIRAMRRISDRNILNRIRENRFGFSLNNKTILLFGYAEWKVWRSTHEYLREFSKDNTVIFVEQKKPDLRLFLMQLFRGDPLVRISERVFLYKSSPSLPYFGFVRPFFLRKELFKLSVFLSNFLLMLRLKRSMRRHGLAPDMLFIHNPLNLFFAGKFGERLTCYRVHDEVALFPSNACIRPFIEEFEKKNLRKANYIFASSMAQTQKREKLGREVCFVPNACDFELYSNALGHLRMPDDIASVPMPRVAYVGVIDQRIDFDLLEDVIQRAADVSFVFIGPVLDSARRRVGDLSGYNNVYFLGEKDHADLPSYLRAVDVSLMPYLINELLKTAFPWKMFEHMAAGKPIVGTPLPEVLPYQGVVMIASSGKEFLRRIRECLNKRPVERIERGIELARQNSWDRRVKQIKELVEGHSILMGAGQ